MQTLWQRCVQELENDIPPQQLNTWIRPLHAIEEADCLHLLAPNRFVLEHVKSQFLTAIQTTCCELLANPEFQVLLEIGSGSTPTYQKAQQKTTQASDNSALSIKSTRARQAASRPQVMVEESHPFPNNLNSSFNFDSFIQGKSNQVAKAAALQVSQHFGNAYNPLVIYGGVGLGKTHLLHAIGNAAISHNPKLRIAYLHAERFVAEMVQALQNGDINQFKKFYRNVDALLIDDIQFFAGKDRSQEEFFYTFVTLYEKQRQIIITCDRVPQDIKGLDERLKSRLGAGLATTIDPPELDTRVAILQSKAEQSGIQIPDDVAYFVAKQIRSNIRELEGALRRVIANAYFMGKNITLDFASDALSDLLKTHEVEQVTVETIQQTVSDHFGIPMSELLSARRARAIARPRQIAMSIAKELTDLSLPALGRAFGGRDHTTVLHACRKIKALREEDEQISQDYAQLIHKLKLDSVD